MRRSICAIYLRCKNLWRVRDADDCRSFFLIPIELRLLYCRDVRIRAVSIERKNFQTFVR